jgi:hypothetical protein
VDGAEALEDGLDSIARTFRRSEAPPGDLQTAQEAVTAGRESALQIYLLAAR